MVKLTPNSIVRPNGARVRVEKSGSAGLYVIRDAYEGHYEYFKNRPLRGRRMVTPSRPAREPEDL